MKVINIGRDHDKLKAGLYRVSDVMASRLSDKYGFISIRHELEKEAAKYEVFIDPYKEPEKVIEEPMKVEEKPKKKSTAKKKTGSKKSKK